MGLELPLIGTAGAAAASGVPQAVEARKARKQAEAQAAEERARLEELKKKPPPRLPTESDARAARRRSIRTLMTRRGRQSTIMSPEGTDAFGG